MKIAVLVPCYNEALTIEKVVTDFKRVLPEAEIYVYDNNSTDNTAEVARNAGAIVRYEYKQGKGNVIRSMFQDIEADCYIMVDGDDTYPAEDAVLLLEVFKNRKGDMVIGDRLSSTYYEENERPFHNTGNALVRALINVIYRSDVKDIMTGLRVFSRRFVKSFPVVCKGFELETEMTFHALDKNMNLESVPIEYRDRPDGSESKLNTFGDGARVLATIVRLFKNYKPFVFLGLISIILTLVSLIMIIPVLVQYFQTGLVERFPTLIVSGFVFLGAMISFFSGIILDVLAHQKRQQFEFRLQEVEYQERQLKKDKDTK